MLWNNLMYFTAKATELDKNTVTKAVERLIEKGEIYESPPTNTRGFYLSYPGWQTRKKHTALKYGILLKIPRGDPIKRELVKREKEETKERITLLHKMMKGEKLTLTQLKHLKKLIEKKDYSHNKKVQKSKPKLIIEIKRMINSKTS